MQGMSAGEVVVVSGKDMRTIAFTRQKYEEDVEFRSWINAVFRVIGYSTARREEILSRSKPTLHLCACHRVAEDMVLRPNKSNQARRSGARGGRDAGHVHAQP